MNLAHVNESHLESNLLAAPPSSRLDSVYADLQVHALSVSDGLSRVQTSLGTDSLTTGMPKAQRLAALSPVLPRSLQKAHGAMLEYFYTLSCRCRLCATTTT